MSFDITKLTRSGLARFKPAAGGAGEDWWLIVLGAVIGSFTGLCAIGFARALHLVEHGILAREESGTSWLLIAAPVVGMTLSGILIRLFAPEAKGHGVPQVMKALIKNKGVIKWPVGATKVVA
ncbi:MAG TPA: hypothetical protein ENJ00_08300, partial [Phycisphaerales bacterium]|nr:hypothetical protein [Phycisphaerales bacterium]